MAPPRPDPDGPRTPPQEVRREWEALGASFHGTRDRPWSWLMDRARARWGPGDRVLDLGGGNGRHAMALARDGVDVVAADFARPLVHRAREAARELEGAGVPGRVDVLLADAGHVPLARGSVDGVLLAAVLHAVPGRARRWGALAEARRVLRPGGTLVASVWALWQDRWADEVEADLPAARREGWDVADRCVPWRRDGLEVDRTTHLYRRAELVEDLQVAGFGDVAVEGVHAGGGDRPDNWVGTARAP